MVVGVQERKEQWMDEKQEMKILGDFWKQRRMATERHTTGDPRYNADFGVNN